MNNVNYIFVLLFVAHLTGCNGQDFRATKSISKILISSKSELHINGNKDLTFKEYKSNRIVRSNIEDIKGVVCLYENQNFETEFPVGLLNFVNLEYLWFNNTDISDFPIEIFNFKNLKHLSFSKNRIKFIPSEILKLEKLEYLELEFCFFQEFPEILYELKYLDTLSVSMDISKCEHCFNFSSNQLKKLKEKLPNTEIIIKN